MDTELVRAALEQVKELLGALKPFEQKELMQIILLGAEVNERQLVLEIRAGLCESLKGPASSRGKKRFQRPDWLPGQDSNLRPSG